MLHVDHNLQTLQQLADELLEVGRTSCDTSTPSSVICIEEKNDFPNELQAFNSLCKEADTQEISFESTNTTNYDTGTHNTFKGTNRKEKLDFNPNAEHWSNSESNVYQNQSPMKNLRNLLERKNNQLSSDIQAAETAQKLYNLQGEEKRDIMQYFLQKDDFSVRVVEKYMELFDFSNVSIDESLRIILKKLALEGETQEREKVLHQFAVRYRECNPRFLNGNLDSIHVLICGTALLNTDLHGVRTDGWRRMTCKQFIQNLSGITNDGEEIPHNLLKEIYRSIKKQPLPWCDASGSSSRVSLSKSMSVHKQSKPAPGSFGRSQSVKRYAAGSSSPLGDTKRVGSGRSKTKTIPRKQGILWRKAILESDGNKTVRRKRRWRLFMVSLQGLELQLVKKEANDVCRILIHHSLAEMEAVSDATRRQNVFRLTLANRSSALYQATNKDETESWVNAINRNAALLSAAPLSAGIGSEVKFRRPLMPTAYSTLPLIKQLNDQLHRHASLRSELHKLEEESLVEASASTREFQKEKIEFLYYEVRKYEVYTKCLSGLVEAQSPILRGNEMKLIDKSAIDTQSLLSVCPSEPGVFNKVSSYQSSEEGGSFEDLIDTDRVRTLKRSRGPSTSFLVPTTSLPNLLPLDGDFLLSPTTPYFPSHFSEVSPSPSIEFHSRSDYVASFNSSTA